MSILDKSSLKNFIFEASRATYASGDESIKKKQSDGSTTIEFENGSYKYQDNYFGGEPYGGREVVFLNSKPIWMMVYYGLVYPNIDAKEVYPFLMEALSNNTVDMPYRGPKLFRKGNGKYENIFSGDYKSFSGKEKIYKDDVCIYEASYVGGFVDL